MRPRLLAPALGIGCRRRLALSVDLSNPDGYIFRGMSVEKAADKDVPEQPANRGLMGMMKCLP